MNTKEYLLTDSQYQLISEEDCEVQNNSSYIVRLVYCDVLPFNDVEDFHRLKPNEYRIFKISNLPEGNLYARCENKNQKSRVIVSKGVFGEGSGTTEISNNILSSLLLELSHLRAITQETFDSDLTKEDIEDC